MRIPVSRAVRGHSIVDASLHSLLAAKVIGVTLPAENTDPDLSMESEDVATNNTDDATKDEIRNYSKSLCPRLS